MAPAVIRCLSVGPSDSPGVSHLVGTALAGFDGTVGGMAYTSDVTDEQWELLEPVFNVVLHIMATVQLRNPTEGRAYYHRKIAAGKSSNEAMRCLKRRLSDIVYRTMLNDLVANKAAGPGGHRGASLQSSATGSHPHTGSSDKSLPGPAKAKRKTPCPGRLDTEGSQIRMFACLSEPLGLV